MQVLFKRHVAMRGSLFLARVAAASFVLAPSAFAETTTPSNEERIEPNPKQLAQLQALTPESVAAGAVIQDDDLEPTATITTLNAYQSNGRFTDRVRADNFLRAFIDKRTGQTRYQVYQRVTYNYEDRRFTMVNYATPGGPVSTELTDINHQVVACYASVCSYEDLLGFSVPRSVLEGIGTQHAPGPPRFWRFRFKARNGVDWEDRITPAEVQGLLIAVDQYRTTRGLPLGG